MLILLALFLVPLAALAMVLGMDRVEDQLLKAPARHRSDARARRSPAPARPSAQPVLAPVVEHDATATRVAA
jgi:hypothetical protein